MRGGDFVHLWMGGHAVATGNLVNLYDPAFHKAVLLEYGFPLDQYWGDRYEILGAFFYPPVTALLYSPLGLLSPAAAQSLHAVLTVGLGCLSAWFLTRILQGRVSFPAVFLLLFTFPSFFYGYVLGQNGVLTMTLVLAGIHVLTSNRQYQAGAVWGMLCFKPNWLLALAWIPLVMRQSRMLIGLTASALTMLVVTVAVLGIESAQSFLSLSLKLTRLHELPDYPLASQYSILSLFRRLFSQSKLAESVGWSIAIAIVLVTVITIWLRNRKGAKFDLRDPHTLIVFALALIAAVCINPHLHHYDLLLANVAVVIALGEWSLLQRTGRMLLVSLVIFSHCASVINAVFELSTPLPVFAILGTWLWLLFRVWCLPIRQSIRPNCA